MVENYQRFLTPGFQPFNPLELAKETEIIACRGSSRKYTAFYCTGVYRGISTGYTVGCCLRCVFCWVDWSRDFPEAYGDFYAPEQVFEQLVSNARAAGVKKLRISGGEPTLNKEHLLGVLELVKETEYLFIMETNGIVFGHDPDYVRVLRDYPNVHVRVSLKAGTPKGFQERTGAEAEFLELPFQAIKHLRDYGISFHVAAMSDPRLMPKQERSQLLRRLREILGKTYLEEESCDPYPHTIYRLKEAGFNIFE